MAKRYRLSTTSRGWFVPGLAALLTLIWGGPLWQGLSSGASLSHSLPRGYRDALITFGIRDASYEIALLGVMIAAALWGLIALSWWFPFNHLEIDRAEGQLRLRRLGKVYDETTLASEATVWVDTTTHRDKWDNQHSATRGPVVVRKTVTRHEYRVRVSGLSEQVFWTTNEVKARRRASRIAELCGIRVRSTARAA